MFLVDRRARSLDQSAQKITCYLPNGGERTQPASCQKLHIRADVHIMDSESCSGIKKVQRYNEDIEPVTRKQVYDNENNIIRGLSNEEMTRALHLLEEHTQTSLKYSIPNAGRAKNHKKVEDGCHASGRLSETTGTCHRFFFSWIGNGYMCVQIFVFYQHKHRQLVLYRSTGWRSCELY